MTSDTDPPTPFFDATGQRPDARVYIYVQPVPSLSEVVVDALGAVGASGDTSEVALRLAQRVDEDGATPSTVRELRYALLSLGVSDLVPYRELMRATKAAIDATDDSLPTLAAQLREQEQTCQRLSGEPANVPIADGVRAAVDGVVADYGAAWAEFLAGVRTDWAAFRERSLGYWRVINGAGGRRVFPAECARAGAAFDGYWQGRRRHRRADDSRPGDFT
jgi:hypothetical protein